MKKRNRVRYSISENNTTILHIVPSVSRNEMHFEVQKRTKAQIFKDKTKYTRKIKHKNKEY